MTPADRIAAAVRRSATQAAGEALRALDTALRRRHGEAVVATVFYGSCQRDLDLDQGIADVYVLVDRYRDARIGRFKALLNRLLPPNVYYLEIEHGGRTLRTKYAVVALDQWLTGVGGGWFHPYLWARFAQPITILYARDEPTHDAVIEACARAVRHFLRESVPLAPPRFSVDDVWQCGLLASYATEFRAERDARIRGLTAYWPDYYAAVTAAAVTMLPWSVSALGGEGARRQYLAEVPAAERRRCRSRWRRRRLVGKSLALARLVKSLFTFSGAVPYAAWKIERHTGEPVELPPLARRRPLIGGWVVLWRLLRRGSLR